MWTHPLDIIMHGSVPWQIFKSCTSLKEHFGGLGWSSLTARIMMLYHEKLRGYCFSFLKRERNPLLGLVKKGFKIGANKTQLSIPTAFSPQQHF
jgi:hypothetical protein